MADIVYKVKETLDGYVPSNELKTIKPGVAYYVGMPLAGGADGMLEPTDKDPEYICMADFKPDDEVPRLDVPCMKVGPQIIFKRIDGDEETITQISGGGGGVQSDLSVNDESDPAFVKGVIRHESLPDGYPKTENKLFIDVTDAEWHVGMGYSLTVSPVDSFIPIIKGNKYIIEMNGASKEVECESNGCIIIDDYDLGIVIEINEKEDQTYYLYASYRLPVILKVTAVDALITPIDEKFIPPLSSVTLKSSTEGSSKKFKITVDDSGTLTATEITE